MVTRSKCQGKIRRYGEEYACGQNAAYAVRNYALPREILGVCRHHLAQVIDGLDAPVVEVIPVPFKESK